MVGRATNGAGTPLAARLRELRGPDLTQLQIAELFGVSTGLVSTWESGSAAPPTERLRQYAREFRPDAFEMELKSLLALREATHPVVVRAETLLDVLKDIRWMLQDIRDRLPVRPEERP